jgi:hypothetical protein
MFFSFSSAVRSGLVVVAAAVAVVAAVVVVVGAAGGATGVHLVAAGGGGGGGTGGGAVVAALGVLVLCVVVVVASAAQVAHDKVDDAPVLALVESGRHVHCDDGGGDILTQEFLYRRKKQMQYMRFRLATRKKDEVMAESEEAEEASEIRLDVQLHFAAHEETKGICSSFSLTLPCSYVSWPPSQA